MLCLIDEYSRNSALFVLIEFDRWIRLKHAEEFAYRGLPNVNRMRSDTKTYQTDSLHEQSGIFRPWLDLLWFGIFHVQAREPASEATQGPQFFSIDDDDSPRHGFFGSCRFESRHGT